MTTYKIMEATVDRAVKKRYIPAGDAQAVKQRITSLGSKYRISPDEMAKFFLMETDGLDPKADNGNCYGIFQACNGTGLSTIGETRASMLSKSVLQQLDELDQYWSQSYLRPMPGAGGAELYLTILYPAAAKETNRDKDLGVPGRQANVLYVNGYPGPMTKNSITRALDKNAAAKLGMPVGSSGPPPPGSGSGLDNSSPGGSAISGGGSLPFKGGITKRTNCPPYDFTMSLGKVTTGCEMSPAVSNSGSGMGVAPGGGGAQGVPGTGTPDSLPVEFKSANPIWPLRDKAGKKVGVITSPYGPRGGRIHGGLDIAHGDSGDAVIVAVLPGVVVDAVDDAGEGQSSPSGFGCFGNTIVIKHKEGMFTLYAHLLRGSIRVRVGQQVKQGEPIALQGNSGCGTGPHLHLQLQTGPTGSSAVNSNGWITASTQ